jgi:hypothetical protein
MRLRNPCVATRRLFRGRYVGFPISSPHLVYIGESRVLSGNSNSFLDIRQVNRIRFTARLLI